MELKYFSETDTLLMVFNNNQIHETKDLNENILAEFDKKGILVSMTIEHANSQTNIFDLSFQQFPKQKEDV
ncbi:MAG: DUF2283 domain-containing protein [Bacteroidetes bacterium]|jgi:uncharacterized protein YuzE|nr:DUF2283 domain-containing protein [Bacteroidota bacterium]MBT6686704.1 DUF2283 domain-containing protein [Bacteroidota bacterium]MBT7141842.1 DUF2283 domain-containing protein [Bacteroidota bacterium]MBT7490667.1 DUF2283 domain-containing protein [Bacteroidota bacterium]